MPRQLFWLVSWLVSWSVSLSVPLWALISACATQQSALVPSNQSADAPALVALGGYSARFRQGEAQRNHNIQVAARALDGLVVQPGEVFSFNRAVGPRTAEAGYQVATTLVLDGTEPALGGGVCQVSSVLFNAFMQADVELVERHPHSRPIRYIPPGRDATVSWGHLDLQVRNSHPFPITLRAEVAAHRLTLWVMAPEPLPYEVHLVTEQIEEASAKRPVQLAPEAETQGDGFRIQGAYVKLYRERVADGAVLHRERLASSLYLTGTTAGVQP